MLDSILDLLIDSNIKINRIDLPIYLIDLATIYLYLDKNTYTLDNRVI